jgi:hypothetical protein
MVRLPPVVVAVVVVAEPMALLGKMLHALAAVGAEVVLVQLVVAVEPAVLQVLPLVLKVGIPAIPAAQVHLRRVGEAVLAVPFHHSLQLAAPAVLVGVAVQRELPVLMAQAIN